MFPESRQRGFLDAAVLSRLAGFPLAARRPMQGSVSGRHPSPHRGSSIEFAEYRKYVPGDDPRRIDWRAYGRSDRYFVKEFEADTNLRLCLVVDTSGSMDFGSQGTSKMEYARRIAAALGHLALQQGDAVGLSCVAGGIVQDVPPRRNPSHLAHVFDVLEAIAPKGPSQIARVLHEIAETVSQRALVVILSDLFVDPDELLESFQHLRFRKHDAAVFHLLDPQETAFDFRRPTRFLDMEGGPSIFADPGEIAERYHKALQGYLAGLKRVMLESGVDYHRTSIDDDYEQVLIRFLIGRARSRGVR